MHELITGRPTGLGTSAARLIEELRTGGSLDTDVEEVNETGAAAVTSGPLARLLAGPSDLETRVRRISSAGNAPDRMDSQLHGSPAFRIDEPLGREINVMLMSWAESVLGGEHRPVSGAPGLPRSLRLRPVRHAHPPQHRRQGSTVPGRPVDDRAVRPGRLLRRRPAVRRHSRPGRQEPVPVHVRPGRALPHRQIRPGASKRTPSWSHCASNIDRTAKYGTPQQVARVRHEDLALFVAMCQEASWHMEKKITPVWEYLGGRQANSFLPCMTLIDVIDGYELPHNIYSLPPVRRAVKLAGLIAVLVNDLVSTEKEKPAGVYQSAFARRSKPRRGARTRKRTPWEYVCTTTSWPRSRNKNTI
jgi:2-methylisoborneol synthase